MGFANDTTIFLWSSLRYLKYKKGMYHSKENVMIAEHSYVRELGLFCTNKIKKFKREYSDDSRSPK